jgi:hypothetical protein
MSKLCLVDSAPNGTSLSERRMSIIQVAGKAGNPGEDK